MNFGPGRAPSIASLNRKMASADSQPRFGQSVKGLLSDKVGSCSGDVIALTRQVLKGSRSQEVKRHWVVLITTNVWLASSFSQLTRREQTEMSFPFFKIKARIMYFFDCCVLGQFFPRNYRQNDQSISWVNDWQLVLLLQTLNASWLLTSLPASWSSSKKYGDPGGRHSALWGCKYQDIYVYMRQWIHPG